MFVKDYMTRHPIMIEPDTRVTEAQKLLGENNIRHLPVVGDGKRVLGLVTRGRLQIAPEKLGSLNVWEIARFLADLTAKDDFYGAGRGVNYAHARYFCMYLQHRGLLGRFYEDYRAAHAKGVPAVNVIEAVCGEGIAHVDSRLWRWVMTLKWE